MICGSFPRAYVVVFGFEGRAALSDVLPSRPLLVVIRTQLAKRRAARTSEIVQLSPLLGQRNAE